MSKFRKAILIGLISQIFVFILLLGDFILINGSKTEFRLLLFKLIYYIFALGFIATTYFYKWLYPNAEMLFTPFIWFLFGLFSGKEVRFLPLSFILNWFYYSSIVYLILAFRERRKTRMQ